MKAVFDTNIIIDYLLGRAEALQEIEAFSHRSISRITWLEVLVGAQDATQNNFLRLFLQNFNVIDTNEAIGLEAVDLRQRYRLRVPDALIWATARQENALFVTRDAKDFWQDLPEVRIPYQV